MGTATLAIGISEDDFGEIVQLNQRRIYRLLLSMTRNPDTAETLTQECFLRAFEKRKSFRAEANVSTWLYRIAVNLARDHARNRRQGFWKKLFQSAPAETEEGEQTPEVELLSDTRPSAETVVLAREAADKVWIALDTLPEQQRAVFILRFIEELSIRRGGGGNEPGRLDGKDASAPRIAEDQEATGTRRCEMNLHLNPEEMADATLGLLEPERASHLQECAECRTRTDGYRPPLEQWRAAARLAAVQPDTFWARQRAVISVRLHERSFDRGIRFVWAGALAALLLAAALSWSPNPRTPLPQQASEAQDEALLENMQLALERETPAALQPAEVLTQEMTRARNVPYRSRQGAR